MIDRCEICHGRVPDRQVLDINPATAAIAVPGTDGRGPDLPVRLHRVNKRRTGYSVFKVVAECCMIGNEHIKIDPHSRAMPGERNRSRKSCSRKSSNSGPKRPFPGELLEKVEQLGVKAAIPGGIARESRATRGQGGHIRGNCSRKSSNSGPRRPFPGELLEKVEQLGDKAAISGGIARESRAIRVKNGHIRANCSRKSNNSC
jgi:hypothetical protein